MAWWHDDNAHDAMMNAKNQTNHTTKPGNPGRQLKLRSWGVTMSLSKWFWWLVTMHCKQIMCIEHFIYSFIDTRRFFPLGAQGEDGVVSFVSVLVDLSRRRHRTIRWGSASEWLGWNHTYTYLSHPSSITCSWSLPLLRKWHKKGTSGSTAYGHRR